MPTPTLRRYRRRNWNGDTYSELAYAVFDGNQIVFSGINLGTMGTSTINAAEEILEEICTREQLDQRSCTFFDLQTSKMYPYHVIGEFEYDRLVMEPGEPLAWTTVPCPNEVLTLFADLIGPSPFQKQHAHERRPSMTN